MSEITFSRDPTRFSNAVGSPNIDFMNLFDFREVTIDVVGLAYAAGGPTDTLLQFSTNNSTFDTTAANYVTYGAVGTSNGAAIALNQANAVIIAGRLIINHYDELMETWLEPRFGRTISNNGGRWNVVLYKPQLRITGFRITNAAGINWTTNSGVYVRQRQK